MISSFFIPAILCRVRSRSEQRTPSLSRSSDREQVACPGIGGGVTQLGHRPRLNLADALTGQVEVLPDLLEGARLAAVEAEAQAQDLALTLVEWGEQTADLVGQQ